MQQNRNSRRTAQTGEMATSFGYRTVAEGDKQPLVDQVFHQVARRYDLMNDLMSGGLHRLWKSAMVAKLAPPKRPNSHWRALDVAGGTGDIAFGISEAAERRARVSVVDINVSMLAVGRERAERRGLADCVDFIEGDAEALPFADSSFDAYTIAFGIRNVPHMDRALSEAYRVLRRGGRFLCLEFSEVDLPVLDRLYDEWSIRAIPKIGKWVAGDGEPYRYLVESVRKFPNQRVFAEMIGAAGFKRVDWTNYSGGIAALHSGWKL